MVDGIDMMGDGEREEERTLSEDLEEVFVALGRVG